MYRKWAKHTLAATHTQRLLLETISKDENESYHCIEEGNSYFTIPRLLIGKM